MPWLLKDVHEQLGLVSVLVQDIGVVPNESSK